jgi:hypothetical protein
MLENGPEKIWNDQEEMNHLEKLQTSGQIGEEKWNRDVHWPRLQELREKKKTAENTGPTQAQRDRFNELSKLQTKGGKNWTPELAQEIMGLYPLMNNRYK